MYQIDFKSPIHVHFIGIGGISMSGLAQILMERNFKISGSDSKSSDLTDFLSQKGALVYIGQRGSNILDSTDLIVYTAAISEENPEFKKAIELNIPMISRADLLGQIMKNYNLPIAVSGTHGKTTTSSMISEILLQADLDPTLTIGGILPTIGGNLKIGNSQIFITEACEYTNSFLSFFPKIAVILNVEADHLDFFKDIYEIRSSFHNFAKLLPSDGTLIINGEIEGIEDITKNLTCNIITFGHSDAFDYYPTDITYNQKACGTYLLNRRNGSSQLVTLGVSGDHNIINSLSAIALSDLLLISKENLDKALLHFTGTNRRFQLKGEIGGVTIIDDYAHHPTEITATLKTASNLPHKHLWCVFQPHTYTRTKALLKEFAQSLKLADKIVLADVYAAREKDIYGVNSKTLLKELQDLGCECYYFSSFDEIENFLLENCINGDLLITMGAGDVVEIGESLLGI